jgi:hypothetical protein
VFTVLSAANQLLLSKWCCLQRISICCWNCVVCSELVFTTEIMLPAANQSSLLKLCCLQWTSVRCRNNVVYSESAFATKIVLFCSKLEFTVEIILSAENQYCVIRNKLLFAVEIVLSAANYLSLSNYGVCSEFAFIVKICCLQRISVRCRISIVSRELVFADDSRSLANQCSLTKFCSRFTYLKWPDD